MIHLLVNASGIQQRKPVKGQGMNEWGINGDFCRARVNVFACARVCVIVCIQITTVPALRWTCDLVPTRFYHSFLLASVKKPMRTDCAGPKHQEQKDAGTE